VEHPQPLQAERTLGILPGLAASPRRERPRGIGIAYPDFTSPHLLAATVLAAVRQRARTGRGQELHLTQLSAVLSLLGCEWMRFKATGVQPARNANRHPDYCPHGVYPARAEHDPEIDAWVAMAVRGDGEWSKLCAAMGQPELAADPRFASHGARKDHEDALDGIVCGWTAQRDKWEIAALLQSAGIAAAPVEHLKDMMEIDPRLRVIRFRKNFGQTFVHEVDIPRAQRMIFNKHEGPFTGLMSRLDEIRRMVA